MIPQYDCRWFDLIYTNLNDSSPRKLLELIKKISKMSGYKNQQTKISVSIN